jgi:hypothetical protein
MIKGEPNTEIRTLCICALADTGLAGPSYNLDDVSSYCSLDGENIHVSFYDMERTITKKNKYFEELKSEILKGELT